MVKKTPVRGRDDDPGYKVNLQTFTPLQQIAPVQVPAQVAALITLDSSILSYLKSKLCCCFLAL